MFILGAASIALHLFGGWWLGLAGFLAAVAAAGFFRDPERPIPQGEGLVISPADGRIVSIREDAVLEDLPETRFRRVSIFMSPLDVHVNRVPVSGEVVSVRHRPGRFRAAFSDRASAENERNEVLLRDVAGRPVAFVQIAGWFARRIVCRLAPGQRVERGQRCGLIMFGSRVDVYLPLEVRLRVKVGDRVRAAEAVLGEFS